MSTSTTTAKDLTKEFPRSPYEQLEGIPWLARLIDKVRALDAGTLGEYIPFPCGGDRRFLETAGVDGEALHEVIKKGASDAEIVAWVKANGKAGADQRIAEFVKYALQPSEGEMVGYLQGSKDELAKARPDLDLSKADNFGRLICIEEGHPLPS